MYLLENWELELTHNVLIQILSWWGNQLKVSMNSCIVNIPSMFHIIQHTAHHLHFFLQFLLWLDHLLIKFSFNLQLFISCKISHEISLLFQKWSLLNHIIEWNCLDYIDFFIQVNNFESFVKGLKDHFIVVLRLLVCIFLQHDLSTNNSFNVCVLVSRDV